MPAPRSSLRFAISSPLRSRVLKVLAKVDRDSDPVRHVPDLSSLVVSLTEAGMEYYFLKAVRDAKLGFVARQTAGLGVSGAVRVMSPIVRSILGGADAGQLRAISAHIRGLMA